VRYVQSRKLFDKPLLLGATVNNNPTITESLEFHARLGVPLRASGLRPHRRRNDCRWWPLASGAGNGRLRALERSGLWGSRPLQRGLGATCRNALGVGAGQRLELLRWRHALLANRSAARFRNHYFELGTFGLDTNVFIGGTDTIGRADHLTDVASTRRTITRAIPTTS